MTWPSAWPGRRVAPTGSPRPGDGPAFSGLLLRLARFRMLLESRGPDGQVRGSGRLDGAGVPVRAGLYPGAGGVPAAAVRRTPLRPQLGGPHHQRGHHRVPGDRRADRGAVACRPAETLESGQGQRMHGCRDRGGVVAADQQGGVRRRHQSRRELLLELADFPRRIPPRQAGGIPPVREEGPRPGPGDFYHRRDPHRTRSPPHHPPSPGNHPGPREHQAAAAAH